MMSSGAVTATEMGPFHYLRPKLVSKAATAVSYLITLQNTALSLYSTVQCWELSEF